MGSWLGSPIRPACHSRCAIPAGLPSLQPLYSRHSAAATSAPGYTGVAWYVWRSGSAGSHGGMCGGGASPRSRNVGGGRGFLRSGKAEMFCSKGTSC